MSTAARKIAAIVHCVERARFEYAQAGDDFKRNFTRQDAAVLNVTRACEPAIDLANMLIRKRRIGIPGDARESFVLLERAGIIDPALSSVLQKVVGFRNIAESVIRKNLGDLLGFAEIARERLGAD